MRGLEVIDNGTKGGSTLKRGSDLFTESYLISWSWRWEVFWWGRFGRKDTAEEEAEVGVRGEPIELIAPPPAQETGGVQWFVSDMERVL